MNLTRHDKNWLTACDLLAPLFSTCSRRSYFAVILASNNRVAGIGYNGAPPGMTHCVDGGCPRASSSVPPGSPYDTGDGLCVAQHAEAGALLWSDTALRQDGTLIVNGPPCFDCARLIASSGIARLVCYRDAAYVLWPATAMFLEAVGITVLCVDRDGGSRSTIASTEGMTGAVIDRAAVWQQAFERHQQPAGSAKSSMTYPDEGPHPRHSTAGRRRIVVSSRGRAGAIVPPGDFRSGLVDALDDQAFIEPWCDR